MLLLEYMLFRKGTSRHARYIYTKIIFKKREKIENPKNQNLKTKTLKITYQHCPAQKADFFATDFAGSAESIKEKR